MSQNTMSRRAFLAGAAAGTAGVAALAAAGAALADEAETAAEAPAYEGTYDLMSQYSTFGHGEHEAGSVPETPEDYIESKGNGGLNAGGMVDGLGITPADFMLNVPAWLGTKPAVDDVADTEECDVLVIGAGNAGSAAALRCAEAGLSTILAETQTYEEYDEYAGDMCCYNNHIFLENGTPEIDPMEIFNEFMRRFAGHANESIVRDFASRSGEAFDWLCGYIPQEYVDTYAHPHNYRGNANYNGMTCGANSFRGMIQWRDNESNINMWPWLIRFLHAGVEDNGSKIAWGYQAIELVQDDDGAVTGAIFCDVDGVYHQIDAKAVIMCAGDFGGNPDMRLDLNDQLRNLAWSFGNDRTDVSSIGGTGRDGSGIKMCLWAGATMEAGPRAAQACAINSAPENLAFGGAWPCFGSDGKRFFNESLITHGTYGFLDMLPAGSLFLQVTDANWEENLSHQGYGHETMDRSNDFMVETISNDMAAMVKGPDGFPVHNFARNGREVTQTIYAADTLEEVAEIAGLDEEATANFLAEVEHWNEMCEAGHDDDWGCDPQLLMPIKEPPFIFGFSLSGTYPSGSLCQHGGVCTNGKYQVLFGDKTPIPGLYAAGNNCGQRMGVQYTTPTAGNSCGSAMTSGYCAAESVIEALS